MKKSLPSDENLSGRTENATTIILMVPIIINEKENLVKKI